jgi:1-aminocyclopropane-1-carboxylate deaminase
MSELNKIPSEELSTVHPLQLNDLATNLFIKRDDLIHSLISGNKWRKLKYNLLHVQQNNLAGVLTFGGAYSNHLLAVAMAGKIFNIKTVGVVRGDELTAQSNMILSYCDSLGMQLKFVSREDYQFKDESEYKQELLTIFENYWIIPEGGGNYQGVIGCMEIMSETSNDFDYVCVAQGTTATSLGILLSIPSTTKLLVCPSLRSFDSVSEMKNKLMRFGFDKEYIEEKIDQVIVLPTDDLGGYGKATDELKQFAHNFTKKLNIPIDFTYNAKALYKLNEFIQSANLVDQKILYVHTGGFS